VIHFEHPSFETDGGHAQQIRKAIEQGLTQAIGGKQEPDRSSFNFMSSLPSERTTTAITTLTELWSNV
jgi:hypothetical protein